jgi:hypothetical protein
MGEVITNAFNKEVLVFDKRTTIHFECSPQLRMDFIKARTELGEYNTMSSFFTKAMTDYVNNWKEMKQHD